MKTYKPLFFLVILMGLASPADSGPQKQAAIVEQVLSGDSVVLKGGKTLKYIGLSALDVENKNSDLRVLANESQAFNSQLVLGKKIWIEWGPKLRDNQNRLLGYCFLDDGTFINQSILEAGQARAYIKAPNLSYALELKNAENRAKRAKSGLWNKDLEQYQPQQQFIGEKNTKIYYLTNSPELDRIPAANLVYFGSRIDAKAAGYRACSTCRGSGETPDA